MTTGEAAATPNCDSESFIDSVWAALCSELPDQGIAEWRKIEKCAGRGLSAMTDLGSVRQNNEDFHLAFRSAAKFDVPVSVMVLADGVGGEAFGEVASGIAVETISISLLKKLLGESPAVPDSGDIVSALELSHRRIREEAERRRQLDRMSTTAIAAVLAGRMLSVAYIGDSRVYIFGEDGLNQVTEDHSLVEELIRLERITPEQAKTHAMKNVLLRILGKDEKIEPDTLLLTLSEGDQVLLCSDGLTNMASDDQISSVLAEDLSAAEKCRILLRMAIEGGGRDNISAVLTQVGASGDNDEPTVTFWQSGSVCGYSCRGAEEKK